MITATVIKFDWVTNVHPCTAVKFIPDPNLWFCSLYKFTSWRHLTLRRGNDRNKWRECLKVLKIAQSILQESNHTQKMFYIFFYWYKSTTGVYKLRAVHTLIFWVMVVYESQFVTCGCKVVLFCRGWNQVDFSSPDTRRRISDQLIDMESQCHSSKNRYITATTSNTKGFVDPYIIQRTGPH